MSTVEFEYELGDLLMEKVTGYVGVCMVRAEYSTGCIHYGIQSQELKDGELREWHWLDHSRLVRVSAKTVDFTVDEKKPSGAFPSGPQS